MGQALRRAGRRADGRHRVAPDPARLDEIICNRRYTILQSFAELEQTPGVPGLDLPGMDFVSIAQGYGCDAARIEDLDTLKRAAANAWTNDVPTVLEVSVSGQIPPLI